MKIRHAFALGILAIVGLALLIYRSDGKPNTKNPIQGKPVKAMGTVVTHGEQDPPYSLLASLSQDSDAIVVGQVTTLIGNYPYLRDQPEDVSVLPQRLYGFAVQQVLKGTYSVNDVLHIQHSAGAVLASGTYRKAGVPWLNVADRYILFLNRLGNSEDSQTGYVKSGLGVVQGKHAELGELSPRHELQGIVLIRSGLTQPNTDAFATAPLDQLEPALFSVSEATAIANIQAALLQ